MKKFPLFIAKKFMHGHPRHGTLTHFESLIKSAYPGNPGVVILFPGEKFKEHEPPKIHTIRNNYQYWSKVARQVNAGDGVLILKQWTDRPYHSKSIEILRLEKIGIQKIEILVDELFEAVRIWVDGVALTTETVYKLTRNDGLSYEDFLSWFGFTKPRKPVTEFSGCIIHFDPDFKYGK